jgi:hypothetical protein
MVKDSIWYRKIGTFRQFLKDINDKALIIPEALNGWREISYLPRVFKTKLLQKYM